MWRWCHKNKSPKGHWSLTWVQWALLLKVRFLSKWLIRKHDCHICEISPNSKQSWYFNSGYEDAFGLLLLHSDLKKKSFGEGAPHWPIFVPPWSHLWADLAKKPKRMCRAWLLHPYQVWSTSINLFCRKNYVFHTYTSISDPPPFLHLNKYIKNFIKIFQAYNKYFI